MFEFESSEHRAVIPVEVTRNGIFFRVTMNGTGPLWFSLDSGAGTNYIDRGAAKKLGLPPGEKATVHGAGAGEIEVERITDVSFEMPGLRSRSHLPQPSGQRDRPGAGPGHVGPPPRWARAVETGVGLGTPVPGFLGKVDRFRLAGFEIRDVVGVAGGTGLGSRLIGGGVLSMFTVVFDYPKSRMFLEPRPASPVHRREGTS